MTDPCRYCRSAAAGVESAMWCECDRDPAVHTIRPTDAAAPCLSCGETTDYGICDCVTGPTYADAVEGPLATGHGVRR